MQCVAVCCSILQRVTLLPQNPVRISAVGCSGWVAQCCSGLYCCFVLLHQYLQCVAVGVLQWVCCSGYVALGVLNWVCCTGCVWDAVDCSVLQCGAVGHRVLQWVVLLCRIAAEC